MRFVMLVILLCAGCAGSAEPERVCTLIGCNDGLSVVVNSTRPQDLTVNVKAGNQQIHSFTCRAGQPCRAFIDNQTPNTVTVELVTASATVSYDYTPQYSLNRPNGPGCDPECKQATVTASVS